VQTDHFTGNKEFEAWLACFGVRMEKARKGNPRAKVVEAVIGHISTQIERYNPAFSGLNTTAREGRISDEYRDEVAMPNALSWREAKIYVEETTVSAWNNHIIGTLGGAPCRQTPLELFLEKSDEDVLSNEMFLRVVGKHHAVRLTRAGLQITTEQGTCHYAPPHGWNAARVGEWLMTNRGRKFDVYIEEYDQPALVMDNETGKYVAMFSPVDKVEYSPSMHTQKGKEQLARSEAIRKAQKDGAKGMVNKAKQAFPNALQDLENLALHGGGNLAVSGGLVVNANTGEVLKGSIDKDELNAAEEAFKAGATQSPSPDPEEEIEGVHFVWRKHPTIVGKLYKSYNPEHIKQAQK